MHSHGNRGVSRWVSIVYWCIGLACMGFFVGEKIPPFWRIAVMDYFLRWRESDWRSCIVYAGIGIGIGGMLE